MRLPTFKRLYFTDYPQEQQSLISKLSVSLNIGIESLYDALNKKLTLSENIQATVKTLTFSVNSFGIPNTSTSFNIETSGSITGITALKVVNLTNNAVYPTNAPFVSYTQTDKVIKIDNITGLTANDSWQVTLVAWG